MKTRPTQASESSEYFTAERVREQRREIEAHGFIADEFLDSDPDCPVFGLNLACAFPFPATVQSAYTAMAGRLTKLDENVYVYPLWETHITILTFVNFGLHRRPDATQLGELKACINPILELIRPLFAAREIGPFRLEFRPPVLTRKAAILPISNPSGQIAQIRQRAGQLLDGNKDLRDQLSRRGLNVPGIIHSTILRFKKAPRDPRQFTAGFDHAAAAAMPFAIEVNEILLTTETKPYMRSGEILHRFALAGSSHRP